MNDIKKIVEILRDLEKKKVLVLTHHNADVDAIASAIVLKRYLSERNEVVLASCESIAKQTKKIMELSKEKVEIDPDCSEYEFVIVLDTPSSEQLKTAKNLRIDMLIDHHEEGDLKAKYSIIDKNSKSTSVLVYKLLKSLNYGFSEIERKILLCGIVSDTAHLRFADREIFRIIYELLDGINYGEILNLLYVEEDVSDRIAVVKAAKRMEVYRFGELLVAISRLGSHEAIASRNILKLGVDIAVIITKKGNELRISSRGKEKILSFGINLAEIFKDVGKYIQGSGGGHNLAGSANGKVKPYEVVKKFIINKFSEKLGKWKKIKV